MRRKFVSNSMRMNRNHRLHEEEMTLEEKIKKICNDAELFNENFNNFRFSEAYIECGDNLKSFADETEWWGEKFFNFVLKSLKDNNENNKPLKNGKLNCYWLFDNDDYDASLFTYDDKDEWMEAVRQMCIDKEIWTTYNNEYIVDDEDDLILD